MLRRDPRKSKRSLFFRQRTFQALPATGVDTDGTFLFFNCNFNQIAQTDLTGSVVYNILTLPGTFGAAEGLSLISDFSPPPPPPAGVPEPASIALLGTVVALVGLKMRNKTAPPSQT